MKRALSPKSKILGELTVLIFVVERVVSAAHVDPMTSATGVAMVDGRARNP
jgi:hypothetical protein